VTLVWEKATIPSPLPQFATSEIVPGASFSAPLPHSIGAEEVCGGHNPKISPNQQRLSTLVEKGGNGNV
jgi:hypothetical protein